MTKVNHPTYNDDRSVGISLPGIFDFFRISRWQYWHHKSTIEKHLGGEHGWNSWHTHHYSPLIHSHKTTLTHQYTLCSAYFLDSICKSGFVFLLQNNLYCRNSSICQSWAHHFGWRKEAVWVQFLVREDLLSSSVCTHRSPPLPAQNFFFDPLVAQTVKSLPAMQQTQVWSLSWEDPMEREMATHSSILAWKIPQMEEPGRLQSTGSQRVDYD